MQYYYLSRAAISIDKASASYATLGKPSSWKQSGHDNAVAATLSFWGSEQGSEIDRTKKNKMDGNTEKKGKREKKV